jgi:hypothetical protein
MPTPITFTFTDEERQAAMEEGARRQRVNEEKGLRGRNNGPRFGKKALDVHLLGAAGEMAVASFSGTEARTVQGNRSQARLLRLARQ